MVAEGGFYSYYIYQWNKSDKERKIVRKVLRFNTFFARWMQFRVGAIPRLPILQILQTVSDVICK